MMNQVHQVLQTHLVQNLRTQSDSPDSSSSSSTSRTDSGTQSDSPAPSEPRKSK
nr:hypothetical protein [Mycoplasmopsis bovis]